jgi:5-oxoprolinase (ATP-hydrolysing)
MALWQLWIDVAAPSPVLPSIIRMDSSPIIIAAYKLLSGNSGRSRDATKAGIKTVLGVLLDRPTPPGTVEAVMMGTMVATHALLERRGDRVLLVVNRCFARRTRTGNRLRLFDFESRCVRCFTKTDGAEVEPLEEAAARRVLAAAAERGICACATFLIHAWKYRPTRSGWQLSRKVGSPKSPQTMQSASYYVTYPRGDTRVVGTCLMSRRFCGARLGLLT